MTESAGTLFYSQTRDALLARIEQALATAVREALARHKREGNPVAVWRDGKVVWVEPRDIPADP